MRGPPSRPVRRPCAPTSTSWPPFPTRPRSAGGTGPTAMGASADVIIVGAGLSGGAAALAAAEAGRHPLLVDPQDGSAGDVAGAGILGPRDLPEGIRGGFPIERTLGDRRLAFLGASSCVSIDYQEPGL